MTQLAILRLHEARLAGGYIMFSTWPFVSVRLFICYQTCERDILNTNELISMQIATWSLGQGHETVNFGSQEVEGQGHKRSKVKVTKGLK